MKFFAVLSLLIAAATAFRFGPVLHSSRARTATSLQMRSQPQKVSKFVGKAVAGAAGAFLLSSGDVPQLFSPPPAEAATVAAQRSAVEGSYDDPNHPGCLRKIDLLGKEIVLSGSDSPDGSKIWSVKGREDKAGSLLVDFSPKGGPKNLAGTYDKATNSLTWSDGNVWKKTIQ